MLTAADFSYRSIQGPSSTVFASAFQRFARLKKDDDQYASTRYNPTAGAIGYIYSREYWQMGASLSYEHGTRKYSLDSASYRVRSDTPGITLFGGWVNPDGWYVDGSTFLGFSDLKARDLHGAPGNYGGGNTVHNTMFGASLEAGKSFVTGDEWVFTPHVGFDFAHAPSENYWFDGAGGITNGSQNFYEIPVGMAISKSFVCGDWSITPSVDLTLVNSLGNIDSYNAYPGFASRTAKEWKVYGVGADHIGGRIRTGINAKLGERTSVDVDYTYEGRKGYRDHRISAMFGWSF